MRYLVGNIF